MENKLSSNTRKASDIRVINNDEIQKAARRHDRLLSFLNEDEVSLLSNPKTLTTVQVSSTLWTREKLIDMTYHNLTQVNIRIEHNGETLLIPKYSELIIDLAPKLVVYKPTHELTINLSDLHKEIIRRLHELDKKEQSYVLQGVGKRLFRTFFPHYYSMVADLVKINIKK
jgi:hypothetical protein